MFEATAIATTEPSCVATLKHYWPEMRSLFGNTSHCIIFWTWATKDSLKYPGKNEKLYTFARSEEKDAIKKMIPVLERLAMVKEKLGVQKAFHELFLDTIVSDDLTIVWITDVGLKK